MHHAIDFFMIMFSSSIFAPVVIPLEGVHFSSVLLRFALVGALILIEWFQREKEFALQFSERIRNRRWLVCAIDLFMMFLIAFWGDDSSNAFIYFQF